MDRPGHLANTYGCYVQVIIHIIEWSHHCTSTITFIVTWKWFGNLIPNPHHCLSTSQHKKKRKVVQQFGMSLRSPHRSHHDKITTKKGSGSAHVHLVHTYRHHTSPFVLKMWCKIFRTKLLLFSPEGNCFVSKSASFSFVLT